MLSIITIIKGLKVPQGTGSIFEQTTLKNLHLQNKKSRFVNPHLKANAFLFLFCPCKTFFGRFLAFAKPNRPKTGLSCSTWISNCTCRTAMIHRSRISLMLHKVTLNYWGLAPKPPASTHTQKQGRIA